MRIKRIQKRKRNKMNLKLKFFGKIFIFTVFLALAGCNNADDQEQVKIEPDKLPKKISIPINIEIPSQKVEADKSKKDLAKAEPDLEKTKPFSGVEKVEKKSEDIEIQVAEKSTESELKDDENKVSQEPDSDFITQLLAQDTKEETEIKALDHKELYDFKGRVNPFKSLISESIEPKEEVLKKKRTRPKSPLEKLDLSQLKLVAILSTPDGKSAVLEESSGKGYVVEKGIYLGLNSGQIEKIEDDRIIIKEIVEDISGKSLIRERILQIQKPAGE